MEFNTLQQVSAEIAKREGGDKSQNIGQINETTGIMCDIIHEFPEVVELLKKTGANRAAKKAEQDLKDAAQA